MQDSDNKINLCQVKIILDFCYFFCYSLVMANTEITIEKQIAHCEEMAAQFLEVGDCQMHIECRLLAQELDRKRQHIPAQIDYYMQVGC